jgi:DNA-binding NarL/FixJ family response regulator
MTRKLAPRKVRPPDRRLTSRRHPDATASKDRGPPSPLSVLRSWWKTRGSDGSEAGALARGEPVVTFEERERIVISFLVDGLGSRKIAAALGVPTATVPAIVRSIIEKLQGADQP